MLPHTWDTGKLHIPCPTWQLGGVWASWCSDAEQSDVNGTDLPTRSCLLLSWRPHVVRVEPQALSGLWSVFMEDNCPGGSSGPQQALQEG